MAHNESLCGLFGRNIEGSTKNFPTVVVRTNRALQSSRFVFLVAKLIHKTGKSSPNWSIKKKNYYTFCSFLGDRAQLVQASKKLKSQQAHEKLAAQVALPVAEDKKTKMFHAAMEEYIFFDKELN